MDQYHLAVAVSIAGLCIVTLRKHRRRLQDANKSRRGHVAGGHLSNTGSTARATARDVWLDVDTGVDDAQAILLALRSPRLRVVGISCVVGNHTIDKVCAATLKVLDAACAREDLPVGRGCCAPLIEPAHPCPQIHGYDGKQTQDSIRSVLLYNKGYLAWLKHLSVLDFSSQHRLTDNL